MRVSVRWARSSGLVTTGSRDTAPAPRRILGWPSEDVVGKRIDELPWYDSDARIGVRRTMDEVDATGIQSVVNSRKHRRPDGSTIHCEWYSSVTFEEGKVARVLSLVLDVTARVEAETALHETTDRLSLVIDSTGSGYTDWDVPGGRVKYSKRFAEMLGYDLGELEPTVATWERLVHPEDRRRAWDGAQSHFRGEKAHYECEERLKHKDGRWLWTRLRAKVVARDAGGAPLRLVGVHTDITDTRALQAKLTVASRLAATGTLVSGLAHEINNPLAAEMADQGIALEVVREVRDRLLGDSPVDRIADGRALGGAVEALEDAMASGERIARIVKDLSVFGRPDAKRQQARLMDIIDGALRWLPATVARSAAIQVENGGAPDVIASPGQIEQILVNLVTNAARATPEGQRDTVIVRVGPGLPGMARVEVIDHGIGIDPYIRDSVFDPFFTTRPAGPARGTGLGLSICHAIVAAHGGTLTFESEVGKGSTFRVELPAAPAEA